ncbi:hypothetical protein BAS06_02940 [Elizabethkingia miricola]|uniref:hypothetical protein n=1 Tax=Elizabethkingia miricola TaxID=172045 RepID=UPI00099A950B|nr:hypothetical protein [Elizabethkingia miricola]OPB92184.1 hypothetical protein BAS06_02940 [Elizabethkingia miricola]
MKNLKLYLYSIGFLLITFTIGCTSRKNTDIAKKEQIIQKLKDKYPDIDIKYNQDSLLNMSLKELKKFERDIKQFQKSTTLKTTK